MVKHEHHDHGSKGALRLAIAATAATFVVELAGGFWTHSLALLADSAHVLLDLFSFLITLWAIRIAERQASEQRTYGWHRLEVFAALINSLSIFAISFFICAHAVRRFFHPQAILAPEMLGIAFIGLVVNLLVIWRLHPHAGRDLNIRGAFLHALGDALASVAVVAGGGLVLFTGKNFLDPLAAMVVSAILILNAYRVLAEALHILMEGTPKGLERGKIVEAIEAIAGPRAVRDLHVWNLCSHLCALSVHVVLPEDQMARQRAILEGIHLSLEEKFNIIHATIQIQSAAWQPDSKHQH